MYGSIDMYEENEKLRIISPEPVLAQAFRKRKPFILPQELKNYATDWGEDIGRAMRSREYMVGSLVSSLYYVGFLSLIGKLPVPTKERIGKRPLVKSFLESLTGVRL